MIRAADRRPVARVLAGTVVAGLLCLAGCDERRAAGLEEGLSSEVDVRRRFGEPAEVATRPDGSRVLAYPRQPEGATNYEIVIGADGRMSSLRQLLTPANFAAVVPGQDGADVRRRLGRPARIRSFAAAPGDAVWEWRFVDGPAKKVFEVTFDRGGRVRSAAVSDDVRQTAVGG